MSKSTFSCPAGYYGRLYQWGRGSTKWKNNKVYKCERCPHGQYSPLPIMIHLATNVMLDIVNGAESNAKRVQKVASRFMALGIAGTLVHQVHITMVAK